MQFFDTPILSRTESFPPTGLRGVFVAADRVSAGFVELALDRKCINKVQETGLWVRFDEVKNQGRTVVFPKTEKKYRFFCFSPKRSDKRIREVFRGRMESPVLSDSSESFPPERRTKWH